MKYPEDVKEKVYLMYAINHNAKRVSEEMKLPYTTTLDWIRDFKAREPDRYQAMRDMKKRDFIERASELIDKSLDRLDWELGTQERIQVNHLASIIGTLYDKRALAKGESTENREISFKLPEEVNRYAE